MTTVKISLGFEVGVDDCGYIHLPSDCYTSPQLKKIAREVDKAIRKSQKTEEIGGYDYE